tara:strand:- start:26 stop:568 length:543 start_codon:yes stop_codon:yes gene_type:complete
MIYTNSSWDFRSGTRVLLLSGRAKDGVPNRNIPKVSYGLDEWGTVLDSLINRMIPGERIYCSLAPRDIYKAIRLFKEQQLAADYLQDPLDFYKKLNAKWVSCLMKSPNEKVWMFDLDSEDEYTHLMKYRSSSEGYKFDILSMYKTKNGYHVIVKPFNKSLLNSLSRLWLKTDPMGLVAYS